MDKEGQKVDNARKKKKKLFKTDRQTAAMLTALYKGLDEEEISGRVSGKKDEDRLEAGL